MSLLSQSCLNHGMNIQQCPCPNMDCERRAVCCECVAYHTAKGGKTRCMKTPERPAATRSLPTGKTPDCAKRGRNSAKCPCGEASCGRHGLCCDCIRYHWGNSTYPSPACM